MCGVLWVCTHRCEVTTQPHSGQQGPEAICHHLQCQNTNSSVFSVNVGLYSRVASVHRKDHSKVTFEFLLILKLIFNVFKLNPSASLRIKVQLTLVHKYILTIVFKGEIILSECFKLHSEILSAPFCLEYFICLTTEPLEF